MIARNVSPLFAPPGVRTVGRDWQIPVNVRYSAKTGHLSACVHRDGDCDSDYQQHQHDNHLPSDSRLIGTYRSRHRFVFVLIVVVHINVNNKYQILTLTTN